MGHDPLSKNSENDSSGWSRIPLIVPPREVGLAALNDGIHPRLNVREPELEAEYLLPATVPMY